MFKKVSDYFWRKIWLKRIVPRKYKTKDISDFYKCYGKQKTLNLITQFLKWVKRR